MFKLFQSDQVYTHQYVISKQFCNIARNTLYVYHQQNTEKLYERSHIPEDQNDEKYIRVNVNGNLTRFTDEKYTMKAL